MDKMRHYNRSLIFSLSLIMLLGMQGKLHAQVGSWTQKATFPGAATNVGVGFSIGSKGYIGLGTYNGSNFNKDIWEYDTATDAWTQKADYSGGNRENVVCFVIGSLAYVGAGDSGGAYILKDMWAFDPVANSWAQKASITYPTTWSASFATGGKGYSVGGQVNYANSNELFAYDPVADSWSQKSSIPGSTHRIWPSAFGIGSYGYAGLGMNGFGYPTTDYYNDFYRYDPSSDTWTTLSNFGGVARHSAYSAASSTTGYIGTGANASLLYDTWEYTPGTDTWTQTANYHDSSGESQVAFTIGSNLYVGTGYTPNVGANGTPNHFFLFNPPPPVPSFTTQPVGKLTCLGSHDTLTAAASYATSYQWYKNGSAIGGAVSSSFIINSLAYTDTGSYYVTATDATGTSYSDTVTVAAIPTTAVTTGVASTTHVCLGGTNTISATVAGAGLTYQWQVNTGAGFGDLIDNSIYSGSQSGSTLTISNALYLMNGYEYRLTVNGTCGTAVSDTSTLTIDTIPTHPVFIAAPSNIWQGETGATYTVTSIPDVSYTWSYTGAGGTVTPTGASANINFSGTATNGSVQVYVTSLYGCGTSGTVSQSVTVNHYDVWTGAVDADWSNAANWSAGFIPYSSISAYVPVTAHAPVVAMGAGVSMYDLWLAPGTSLTLNNGSSLVVEDTATVQSTISGAGRFILAGSLPQILAAHDTISNLMIVNAGGVTIPAGDTANIKSSYYPTSGTMNVQGCLQLLSDSNGTATINNGSSAGGYITGNVNVQQYIHGGRRAYRFLAHPFNTNTPISQLATSFDITGQGGSANGFTTTGTNNPSAWWYNPVTADGSDTDDVTGWIPYTSMTDTGANAWSPMEGLRIIIRGAKGEGLLGQTYTPSATTINMYGTLNEGDKTVNLDSNTNKGYNFIGNPYASAIDLSTLTVGDSVGANFWVWDPNAALQGAYISQPLSVSYVLPAYSSFVVTTRSASQNTITFHETGKVGGVNDSLFKTTNNMGSNMLQLHITSANNTITWDRLLVYFNDKASANSDVLDAAKWVNNDLNFYTFSTDNKHQSIDVRPYVDGQVIQLGINTTVQQTYSMNADDLNVPFGVKIYLHDKYLNTVQQLSQGASYSFTVNSDANSQGDNRFELNLSGKPNSITNIAEDRMNVTVSPNPATDVALLSYSAPVSGNTSLHITSISGTKVYDKELGEQKAGNVMIATGNMAPGIYLITLQCGNEIVTKRLVKE